MATKDPRKAQIERDFAPHPLNAEQQTLVEAVNADTRRLALRWFKTLPDGQNKWQAIAFLKQARFHANAANAGDFGVDMAGTPRPTPAKKVAAKAAAPKKTAPSVAPPAKKAAAKTAPAKKAAPKVAAAKSTRGARVSNPDGSLPKSATVIDPGNILQGVPFGRRKRA